MSITRRTLIATAASLALALGLQPAAAQQPTQGGDLVMISTQTPRHLNPAVQSGIATAMPGTQIFASPLRMDENWNAQPYLAESWEWAEDGLSLTLKLVERATFHDGHPITSADVAFSIETIKANHPFKTMFAPVESIDTPDDLTAVINLSQPHPALILALSGALCPIIPQHIYGDGQDVASHPANAAPVGSGPFKLESFAPGEQIVMVRNEDFFIEGRPYLDRIIIRLVRDTSASLLSMEAGEGDMLPFLTTSQGISRLTEADGIEVTDKGYAAVGPINWLAFNMRQGPLAEKAVRQAIGYAIDRNFVTKALMRGVSAPQRSPIVESSPFFNEDIPAYDFDLDKANALLDEAGFPMQGDQRFSLTVDYIPGNDEQQRNVAEYLRSALGKVGIGIEVRASADFPTWAKRMAAGDFEMSMDSVFNWGDPVIGVHRTYLTDNIRPVVWANTQGYSNPKVDEILAAAAIELDEARRKALYDEFQMIVGEDLPVYWINALPYHTAYDARLGNVPVSIWGPMQSFDEVYWTEPR